MEWIESYFSYLCERSLSTLLKIPGPIYNQMTFSALMEILWIFKVYIQNIGNPNIILEDLDLISQGLFDFQQIGIILVTGFVEYYKKTIPEEKYQRRTFQKKSEINKEIRLKTFFNLGNIDFIPFSSDSV